MTEGIWVTIAFVVLVGLIFMPVKKAILAILDNYITDTRSNFKEAEKLCDDAKQNLATAQDTLSKLRADAELALKRCEDEVSSIIKDAEQSAKSEMEKQMAVAQNNFEARQSNLIAEIKERIVSEAVERVSVQFDDIEKDIDYTLIENSLYNIKSKTRH